MHLDQKLTWKEHFKQLKTDCNMRMNILRTLNNYNAGADLESLIMIYKSLIRSKIDYGCHLYITASKTALKHIDTIHTTALRLILGAFRSSPLKSIHSEIGEPPLQYRREQLLLTYVSKIACQEDNPAFQHIFQKLNNKLIIKNKTKLQNNINMLLAKYEKKYKK